MDGVDPRLRAALLEQLARRRETLAAGARHVGWKLGVGERDSIGGSIAVGYLTSATCLASGATYRLDGLGAELRADVELAVELGADVDERADADFARGAVAGYAAALEIVDLAPVLDSAEAVVAANVFHRAVAFGPTRAAPPDPGARAVARVNGRELATAGVEPDLGDRLAAAARILAGVGERLSRGDVVITGSIVQVAIAPDDDVEAEVATLGSVRLRIAP